MQWFAWYGMVWYYCWVELLDKGMIVDSEKGLEIEVTRFTAHERKISLILCAGVRVG